MSAAFKSRNILDMFNMSLLSEILIFVSMSWSSKLCLCVAARSVDRLLQLPLQDEEERSLVEYLKNTQEANGSELLVLHYLQRSRFIEAIRLNNRIKATGLVSVFLKLLLSFQKKNNKSVLVYYLRREIIRESRRS